MVDFPALQIARPEVAGQSAKLIWNYDLKNRGQNVLAKNERTQLVPASTKNTSVYVAMFTLSPVQSKSMLFPAQG